MSAVRLSLISHTNVGKTTLARTLVKRDVGEVRDAAHVTDTTDNYLLIETTEGDALELWDTPGFGDSARLLRRLRQGGNPLGWFLTQVWDRYTDRPFFSSQQAIRNVRDVADVVLYLVNASEDPAAAGYVAAEMEILGWIGKPVLVLLNQLGPPQTAAAEAREIDRWSRHLAPFGVVRGVVAFDAFARCWVQERLLLERVGALVPTDRRESFGRIAAAWDARNEAVFDRSIQVLARHLAGTAVDQAEVPTRSLGESARALLGGLAGAEPRGDPALGAAQAAMARRLDESLRESTAELIQLHGLSGQAADEIDQRMGSAYTIDPAADVTKASVIGGAVTGALGGLAADLAAGGLTFGAGAVIGGLLGAAGMHGLARAYNLARGKDASTLRWSPEFLTGRVTAATLRYLAVAHFGRGRGDYVQAEYPPHWRAVVEAEVSKRRAAFDAIWATGLEQRAPAALEPGLGLELRATANEVLRALYPQHLPRP
jgi:hypothetical protein